MPIIELKNLTHIYLPGTPYEKKALDNVSLSIEKGDFIGIVGLNGSGKSTLMQHLNGLLLPTSGSVVVCGKDISNKVHRTNLWKEVGLLFQFPEHQFFEVTVFKEIAFGLKNLGLNADEIEERVNHALKLVGLNPKEIAHLSPLALSGGNRRQVALASIFAMYPTILVLDEPTAGLDPKSCDYVFKAIREMQREYNTTVIMVSHHVNDLILLGDKIAILEKGKIVAYGKPNELLQGAIHSLNELILPEHLKLVYHLINKGYEISCEIYTLEEVTEEIARLLKESNK